MANDRARVSYDEHQQYRSVVMQQGRVTLEADWNEASDIASEELRKETLDIVGNSGTPDNGYQIVAGPGFDFSIGPGIMYVGGERVELPAPVVQSRQFFQELLYSQQDQVPQPADPPRPAEWLDAVDAVNNPDWVPVPTTNPGSEFIYLRLREQEVSAVEDSDLKDVALGGPDTAQRTRLIQHIVRVQGQIADCTTGFVAADMSWLSQGLDFDRPSMRLLSGARLQVGFTGQALSPDPCQPQAQNGYLGADNQLIRVQISSVAQPTTSTGRLAAASIAGQLLWGYDDASFLYRVDVVTSTTLHLQTAPVDAFHQPRVGQAVEVLLPAVQLSNGEFVAAPTGFVTTVSTPYNPDTQTIGLTDGLPVVYGDGTAAHPSPLRVFLRVWEQQLPFTPDVAVPLDATGLQVTLTLAVGNVNRFHVGDFWMFAARPATPQQVYPERFLAAPQPPNGPRLWACPLATITWGGVSGVGGGTVQDCRQFFSPLNRLVFAEANGSPPVGPRDTLNFIGAGITVADNAADKRIDITIPGGGAGAETSPTVLLFPVVVSRAGFDTSITVVNTTLDPLGTTPQSGDVTFDYFPNPLGTPQVQHMNAGDFFNFSVSSLKITNYAGYVIAVCKFAGAYGFASIVNANQASFGSYLAIVLPPRPIK